MAPSSKQIVVQGALLMTVYFGEEDISGLVEAFRDDFNLFFNNVFLIQDQKYFERLEVLQFQPYKDRPEVMMAIRLNRRLNSKEAMRYLEYLGFDQEFAENLVYRQAAGRITCRLAKESLSWVNGGNPAVICRWVDCLLDIAKGTRLKDILTTDPKTATRWNKKVGSERDWENIRLSREAAIRVTRELWREAPAPYRYDYEVGALKQIVKRVEQASRANPLFKKAQDIFVEEWGALPLGDGGLVTIRPYKKPKRKMHPSGKNPGKENKL